MVYPYLSTGNRFPSISPINPPITIPHNNISIKTHPLLLVFLIIQNTPLISLLFRRQIKRIYLYNTQLFYKFGQKSSISVYHLCPITNDIKFCIICERRIPVMVSASYNILSHFYTFLRAFYCILTATCTFIF